MIKLMVYGESEGIGLGKILGVAESSVAFPILADDVPYFSQWNVLTTSGASQK